MRKFAFVANRVESWNFLLNFRLFKHLHRNSKWHWFWIWLAPLYWTVSVVSLFRRKGHDVVDDFHFLGETRGQTILLKNYGWHFMLKKIQEKIKKRIAEAVLDAQREGNEVIGLGALTKAEWLTKGGRSIVDFLGDSLQVPLVHGDTLTAATVLKQVSAVMDKYGISHNSPIFITGSTSKIGRALVLVLAKEKIPVKMFTGDKTGERYLAIKKEAGDFAQYISRAFSFEEGNNCRIWLTGKSKPSGKKLIKKIPRRTILINFSVPNPLGENSLCLNSRPDLTLIEGGLLAYDPSQTDLRFTMRLRPGLTYACHAGTAVHVYQGWPWHEVDQVELSMLEIVWETARAVGFFLPGLPELSCAEVKQTKKDKILFGKKMIKEMFSLLF